MSPLILGLVLAAEPAIQWQQFEAAAFDRARRERKVVFVEVGIEGCTACRWMHEITLTDPAVKQRLASSFVSIQIDADQQPDLGARFEEWGWPALVFYRVDDHGAARLVRAIRGNKTPKNFLAILEALAAGKGEVTEELPEVYAGPKSVCQVETDRSNRSVTGA